MNPPEEQLPETLSPGASVLRRLCLKDQGTFHIWSSLIGGSPKLETLILARNLGTWDQLLEGALGEGQLSELSQVDPCSIFVADCCRGDE